jgi:hypothetical protein
MPNIDQELLASLESQSYSGTSLDLSAKQLADADIALLCPLLTKNPKIITLDLRNNSLTNVSATLLAENTTLRTLRLKPGGNNGITIAGLQVFLKNQTITCLPFTGGRGDSVTTLRNHIETNFKKIAAAPQQTLAIQLLSPMTQTQQASQQAITPVVRTSFPTKPAQTAPASSPPIVGEPLITDVRYFPRSEYYARFEGTTVFAMNDPSYWGTYHRSESSRFFDKAGGRQQTQFTSPCAKKLPGTHSFFAHTGGFHSPFSVRAYSDAVQLEEIVAEGGVNVRDRLLLYKNAMAKVVVESFARLEVNEQKMKKYIRPIVYTENDYPCVLINLPVLNPVETKTEATRYWAEHPKPFQQLLLSSFIAFLNVEAMRANIPIEMVLRASFGHNQPSICETNNTFRINIGLIPNTYAKLIGKALHLLNQAISAITDASSPPAPFDARFLAQVRAYNAKKIKEKINENARYQALRGTRDFQKAEHSDEAFESLYQQFCLANKEKAAKGGSRFQPVILKGKTIWQAIRQAGDSMGKSVLSECFRQKGTEDWFANQVMEALLSEEQSPIETALHKLLSYLSFGKTVSMHYEKIHRELKCDRRKFSDPSFERLYAEDPEFLKTVQMLCDAFLVGRPSSSLYAVLEQAGTKLLTTHRDSEIVSQVPDFGSDSEFSDELGEAGKKKRAHLSHRKLRVCAGMKAILLAQYGVLSYLKSQGIRSHGLDVQQMYYEVEDALKLIDVSDIKINEIRAAMDPMVLHFDLNHCNAANAGNNVGLKEKLPCFNSGIVILDYTSSTIMKVEEALQQCFFNENIKLVMLVNSGLKNDQGGLDFNPYGEIRVCARDRSTVKEILEIMHVGLSEEDKLSQKSHEMVRVCKRRGMAFSLFGLFKTEKNRFQVTEEERRLLSLERDSTTKTV